MTGADRSSDGAVLPENPASDPPEGVTPRPPFRDAKGESESRRDRPAPTRRISRGNLWGILQGRLHVPLGDLRRQFQIDSDDVSPIPTPEGTFYVGLPADGAAVLGQLWHEGRIVFDCTPDLRANVVRAIAPTRPTRPPVTRTPTMRPGGAPRSATPRPLPSSTPPAPRPFVAASPPTPSERKPPAPSLYRTGVGARGVGAASVDDFLPAPDADAFEPTDVTVRPTTADAPPVRSDAFASTPDRRSPSAMAPDGATRDAATLPPRPAPDDGARTLHALPAAPASRDGGGDAEAAGDDTGVADDGGRRRRRGGIGRGARTR